MIRARAALAIVAVAVGAPACSRETPLTAEGRARETWVRGLAEREGLADAWSLMSRADVQFEDGLGPVEMTDPTLPFAGWKEVVHGCATGLAQPIRWMGPRSHLRLRGATDMTLDLRGRVDLANLMTRPLVTASLDGREIHAAVVDEDGYFRIAATVPHALLAGWSDLYITLSSVHEPWRDPNGLVGGKLIVARIEHVTWEPVAGSASAPGR